MRENILWLRRIAPQPKTELPAKTDCRLAAVFCPKTTAKPRPNTKPKSDEARHITLAACAPTEWSRRRNVVGVAVPALVRHARVYSHR